MTKEAKNGEAVSVADVSLHLYADTALIGWKDENGNTVGDSVTVNGANITLTPIISDGYWITYKSGRGSSYIWLLVVSLFFYVWGEPLYVLLMILSIAVNYFLGRAVSTCPKTKKGKKIVALGCVFNLMVAEGCCIISGSVH